MPWLDPLLAAAQYKSPLTLAKLLRPRSCSVDGPFQDSITPLQIAAENDDISSVRCLIKYGANVNLRNTSGETALHLAAYPESSLRVFKELLKAGADVNIKNITDKTPLHIACLEKSLDKVKILLKRRNPPVNEPDEEGATPMHLMVYVDNIPSKMPVTTFFKLAIRKGFDVNSQTFAGETILHVAGTSLRQDREIFIGSLLTIREALIAALLKLDGIDVTLQDEVGDNFLHTFLRNRGGVSYPEEFLCYLLDKDLSPISRERMTRVMNQRNNAGRLPVSEYIIQGLINVTVVKHCIDFVNNINVQENFGHTLIHITAQSPLLPNQKVRVIRHLVARGAGVNIKDIFGRTPIFFAQDFKVVQVLVENGAIINTTDQCKRTPLIATLRACNSRICQYLINKGCQINACDKYGYTALHYAAWENRLKEIEVLIRNGANVYQRDRAGRTPYDVARYWRCQNAMDILNKAMTKDTARNLKRKREHQDFTSQPDPQVWIHLNRTILYTELQSIPNLKQHFGIPDDLEVYFSQLMKFPGIGSPYVVDEAVWIESLVLFVMERIARQIGDLDKRFKCSVFRSGSTCEGTKIDDPDEYDFLLVLDNFSEICQVQPHVNHTHQNGGFERALYNGQNVAVGFQRYFDHEKFLLCGRLRSDFFNLVNNVLTSKAIWIFDEVYIDGFSISNRLDKPVVNFRLFVIGELYKGIFVSIDVVPALRVNNWRPVGANMDVSEVVTEKILKENFLLLCQEPMLDQTGSGTFFRISCASFEIKLMHSFPAWIRQSYALAKLMKCNFTCPKIKFLTEIGDGYPGSDGYPGIDGYPDSDDQLSDDVSYDLATASDEISSYMLKTSLFHVVTSEPKLAHALPFPRKSFLYNSIALALRVYKFLGKAAETGKLPVYFLPYLNIFGSDEEPDVTNFTRIDQEVRDLPGVRNVETSQPNKIKVFCDFIIELYHLNSY